MMNKYFWYFKRMREWANNNGYIVKGKKEYVKHYKRLFLKERDIEDIVEAAIVGYFLKRKGAVFYDVFDSDILYIDDNTEDKIEQINLKNVIKNDIHIRNMMLNVVREIINKYGLREYVKSKDKVVLNE